MSTRRLWPIGFALCCALEAQNGAEQLRTLLRETPRLPLESVQVSAQMPNAALLGIVSSVAEDRHGIIYVLQRGDKADPVIAITQDGRVLRSWGRGMYVVPHSIRVDAEGNIWTVDAGNSVLLKFTPQGKELQRIEVGEVATGSDCAFPGLCGTTDVTFGPNGRLFISDGYGNARILEYSADGKRLKLWGSKGTGPGQFQIPHGIAFDGKVLYVADRTNARVQRFEPDGRYLGEWRHLGRPFALSFTSGALWVALMTIPEDSRDSGNRAMPWIVKVDPTTGKVLAQVEAPGPHSIDVDSAGEIFANGCCGGANPSAVFALRRKR